ncbi:MAG: transglutaminase-like cysteine peptidase [Alphaproteobacteria bacterium]
MVERLRADAEAFAGCAATPGACPSRLVAAWVAELDVLRERAPMSRLAAVNRLVNMTPYRRDSATYGVRDHWASPGEFLVNGGDCEDIALFKFFLLRRLGFADDRLRIVFVREDTPWVSHAVLAVHLDGEVYILDNLTDSVLPQGRVAGYAPLYSANETTRWAHFAPPRLIASPDHS